MTVLWTAEARRVRRAKAWRMLEHQVLGQLSVVTQQIAEPFAEASPRRLRLLALRLARRHRRIEEHLAEYRP